MQNVGQSENRNIDKVNVQLDVVKSSTPQSSASSPAKSETETYSGAPAKYMTDSSESEDDSVSEMSDNREHYCLKEYIVQIHTGRLGGTAIPVLLYFVIGVRDFLIPLLLLISV
ncbi:unnamed protein product [Leptidea sinapis]|uniref:Uncharacterized protein n=1 Tax=Leptidea sinapis TaxID=189913 RepID=A0A5E4R698_9NEOP|nr:unnamed protein product [Leptidea sinapis]